MPGYPTFSTRVIGQAEKTLNAILGRLLAGTGLTEPQWVVLTLAATDGGATGGGATGRDRFTGMVAGALKISAADAQALVADMVTAERLQLTEAGSAVAVTGAGQQLHGQIRATIDGITERLWGDLPAEDLATAGRVLAIVTERASAELAR
jgi:DNA-binding MarR family transcriptional regulator